MRAWLKWVLLKPLATEYRLLAYVISMQLIVLAMVAAIVWDAAGGVSALAHWEELLRTKGLPFLRTLAARPLQMTLWIAGVGTALVLAFSGFAYRELFIDLRQKRELRRRIVQESSRDALTGALNRAYFMDYFEYAIRTAMRDGDRLALFYLDLDRFEALNDALGYRAGDEVLRGVAGAWEGQKRDDDVLARVGSDEFALLVPHPGQELEVLNLANRLMASCRELDALSGRFELGACVGIVFFPEDGTSPDVLLRKAELAAKRAKRRGRHQVCFYRESVASGMSRPDRLRNELARAISRKEIYVAYQPIVEAESGRVTTLEALARWRHPEYGDVSPGEFLPLAEEARLMPILTRHILTEAVRDLAAWHALGLHVSLSVNVSAQDCQLYADLAEDLSAAVAAHRLSPGLVEVELTEQSLMEEGAEPLVRDLCAKGFRIALDDFGTGYASLAYLRRFQVSRIKIDRSYVARLFTNVYYERLLRAVMALARELGLAVTAEGVETEAQEAFLREIGVDRLQGFRYSAPVPMARVAEVAASLEGYAG
ncbi:putative bifunctional diguanylate cyclase/phosphodiesterase [Alicyclobacillus vulcanalis]|uniref:Diguanylate cyclase (GGDEF) domain-containing protein n=1 Tax=Alicyclobacillus vulcanalis TaxID=252246 RepID=A0A1N7PNG5_9BACL|nr:bifunctional diguanylate cyclase/phosphodiesterase [Alicyclobacillus vulcanalis]SIT12155.1 diguanylate cyclase (GGDEF) domain-containing protein [Alicyclobacillus vulcanalis]